MRLSRVFAVWAMAVSATAMADISVVSPLPAAKLQQVRSALPAVAFPALAAVLQSSQTLWYDRESVAPSYQGATEVSPPVGANSNNKWFNLIADSVQPTALKFYDKDKNNFLFPFGTTAGTDASTNLVTFNFLWLPAKDGKLLPVAVDQNKSVTIPDEGIDDTSWGWIYPVGAVVGEVLFISDGTQILPTEVRTRTRTASGWAADAFRPFPTAAQLSAAIQAHRPNWASVPALKAMVEHLADSTNLTASSLHATKLPGVFDQDGSLDVLPDFGDPALVAELLTQTTFSSAYGIAWKTNGAQATYAASTQSDVSIVPKGYTAGLIEVTDDSCARCHAQTGRPLASFGPDFDDIVLYGEMWGRDGIFSFHPFDESQYPHFWNDDTPDNRQMNPNFLSQGVIAVFDAAVHVPPAYPANEVVGH